MKIFSNILLQLKNKFFSQKFNLFFYFHHYKIPVMESCISVLDAFFDNYKT
jgi:hypothetical protein